MIGQVRTVGISGAGYAGNLHANLLASMEGIRLVGIADPDSEQRMKAHSAYGCETFLSLAEMLSKIKPQVVIIATHIPLHYDQVTMAIQHGCNVLCEKPLAGSLQECDAMIHAARSAGVVLGVHLQMSFSDAAMRAKEIIEKGEIGDLYWMFGFTKGRLAASDQREVLHHLLFAMQLFAGTKPSWVTGRVFVNKRSVFPHDIVPIKELYPQGRDSGYGAGDFIRATIEYENGVQGEVILPTVADPPPTFGESGAAKPGTRGGFFVELWGTKGRLRVFLPAGSALWRNDSPLESMESMEKWRLVEGTLDLDPVYAIPRRRLMEDFLQAVRTGRDPVVSGEAGRWTEEVDSGIWESNFTRSDVSIPLEERVHPFVRYRTP